MKIMKKLENDGFVCAGIGELQFVRGGVSVACFENFWGCIKKAFDFLMEYHKDIVDGFKRGWNNF